MSNFVDWFHSIQGTGPSQADLNRQKFQQQQQTNLNKPAPALSAWDQAVKTGQDALVGAMNWDIGGFHPIRAGLNVLTAGSVGFANAEVQRKKRELAAAPPPVQTYDISPALNGGKVANQGYKLRTLNGSSVLVSDSDAAKFDQWDKTKASTSNFGQEWNDYWGGVGAALTDNVNSPNYHFGADIVEADYDLAAKAAGRPYDPNAYDSNEWVRGIGGLTLDIVSDPLTYLGGGIAKVAAAGIRGSVKGAQAGAAVARAAEKANALKTAGAGIKGAVLGTYLGDAGASAYRVGRFSKQIKPAGVKQMLQVSDYNQLNKLAKARKVSVEDTIALAEGRITAADLATKLNKEAQRAAMGATGKAAKKLEKTQYTEIGLKVLADDAAPLLKNASPIYRGEWQLKSGKTVANRAYQGVVKHPVSPETSFGPAERQAWDTAREAGSGATTSRITPIQDAPPGMPVKATVDEGSLPTSSAAHNTVAMPDHEILGIRPGMTPIEARQAALDTLIATHPASSAGNAGAHESVMGAVQRLFPDLTPDLPQAAKAMPDIPAAKPNPTVYPDPVSDTLELGARMAADGGNEAAKLEQLKQLNQVEFPANSAEAVAQRAAIMDDVVSTVVGEAQMAEMRMRLGLAPDESLSRFWFGENRYIQSLIEGQDEVVYEAIDMLAKLPIEIPEYTSRARDIITRASQAKTPADRWAIISIRGSEYKTALESVGAASEDAAAHAVTTGNKQWLEDIANGVASAVPEDAAAALAAADTVVEHPGASVDIFGRIVDNPEVNLQKIVDDAISSSEAAVKGEKLPVKGMSVDEFKSMTSKPQSANSLGRSGADAIPERVAVGAAKDAYKAERKMAVSPAVPQALNDIYDHVVGFARLPLEFPEWITAVRRIAESTAAKASDAQELLKKFGFDGTPNRGEALKFYEKNYLQAFNKAENLKVDGVADMTAGVDFRGQIYRDGGQSARKLTPAEQKLADAAEAATAAEQNTSGAIKYAATAKRRDVVGRQADNNIIRLSRAAKAKAGAAGKTDDPIMRKATDGAWLSNETLASVFTKGSVSASAVNRVLHAKIVGNGLAENMKRVIPLVQWKRKDFRVMEQAPLFADDAAVAASADHLLMSERMFTDAFKEVITETLGKLNKKVTSENIAANIKLLRSKIAGGRKEFMEVADDGGNLFGHFGGFGEGGGHLSNAVTATPWRNIAPISNVLDKALEKAGITLEYTGRARTGLWEAIAGSLQVSPAGVLRINRDQLVKLLHEVKIETGTARVANTVEIREGAVDGYLRNVAGDAEFVNRELGVAPLKDSATPAQMVAAAKVKGNADKLIAQGQDFLTYAQQGTYEASLQNLFDLLKTTEVHTVDAAGNKVAVTEDMLRQIPEEAISVINEAIARGIGDTEAVAKMASGQTLTDYYRSKLPQLQKAITENDTTRLRQIEAINATTVWHGDEIARAAKTMDVEGNLQKITQILGDQFRKIQNPAHTAAVNNAAADAYQTVVKAAKANGGIFRQEGMDAAFARISRHIDDSPAFKPGSAESWQAKQLAMRKLNLQLAQSGIHDVTSVTRYGGRITAKAGLDPDHAYISAIHVMDAIESVMPAEVNRVLFDALKIEGHAMPTSVATQAAVWGMKLSASGMDVMGRKAWLNDIILSLLGKTKAGRSWGRQIRQGADTPASRSIAMLAEALSNDSVMMTLRNVHIARGGMAAFTAERNSVKIATPIMDRLSEVADNIFSHAGERSQAMDSSINLLRDELKKAGYGKGSMEHVISSKMLENRLLDAFSSMEHNAARVTRRMRENNKLPAAERQAAVNAERAATAHSLIPAAHEIASENTALLVQKFMNDPEANMGIYDALMNVEETAVQVNSALYDSLVFMRKELGSTPSIREVGRTLDFAVQQEEWITNFYKKITGEPGAEVPVMELPGGMPRILELIQKQRADLEQIYYAMKDGSPIEPAMDSLIMAEKELDDAVQSLTVALPNEIQRGWGTKLLQAFSQFGRRELTPTAGAIRMTQESASKAAEVGLENAWRYAKKSGIAEADQARIIQSLINAPGADARLAFVQSLTEEQFQFAKQVFTAAEHMFDGSAITRAGITTSELNVGLQRTALRDPKTKEISSEYFFPRDLELSSVEAKWREKIAGLVGKSASRKEHDWLKILKGYNEALHSASIMPAIGADFSARWGHRAVEGMTEADAVLEGWVKIKPHGEIGTHIDPTQYYPRDMVKELANLEKLYSELLKPSGNKFIYAMDKMHNFLKSTITLWMPRNHAVNILGEYMANLSAGVYNPRVYGKAMKVLKDGGYLDNIATANKSQTSKHFLGETPQGLPELPGGKGISIHVGGKNVTMSHADVAKLLDQHGITIINNTVEDLLYHSGETVRGNNIFTRVGLPFVKANRSLGHVAARRDNLFRVAHAIKIMEEKSFRSVNEMMDAVQREIFSFHPTMHHLSSFEQKYMRRIVFFYTWQRGMLSRTMRTLVENPVFISNSAKVNYNASIALGGDPVAPGDLAPNSPDIPSWMRGYAAGPVWQDANGNTISTSINNPMLDTMQKYFGGLSWNSNLRPDTNLLNNISGSLRANVTDQLSPAATLGDEALKWVEASRTGIPYSTDVGQMVTDMSGFGSLSRATGYTLVNKYGIPGFNTTGAFLPHRSDYKDRRDYLVSTAKGALNFWTPFRFQAPSEYASTAQRERTMYNKQLGKYYDPNTPDPGDRLWGQFLKNQGLLGGNK